MGHEDLQRELLLRCIDGVGTPEECLRAADLLRTDARAREFLREVAEQSVMIGDLERMALGRQAAPVRGAVPVGPTGGETEPAPRIRRWRRRVAAAAALLLLPPAFAAWLSLPGKAWIARISKVTGSTQIFRSRGQLENALETSTLLSAGDTLETRSCDAWIELELRDGSKMTIGQHSALRILGGEASEVRFDLERGSLWVGPGHRPSAEVLVVQTTTVLLEARGAQLDIQTFAGETMVRVNQGSARVRQQLDGSEAEVTAGCQVASSLDRKEPLSALVQPVPVDRWACDLEDAPSVIVGRWLPPSGAERARLGAAPLLWPVPGRDPVMLYAAALSVSARGDRPVLLGPASRLAFRGKTTRAKAVRFGFRTQKMRGVFAGKFEVDVGPGTLGPVGQTWEVELPLSAFKPLQPQLSLSSEGLELTDVYALTIQEDAGLEIRHIELLPRGTERPPEDR